MLGILWIWGVLSPIWAFSIEKGEYICVQSTEEVESRKERALEKTLDAMNFLTRSMAESRLRGKPYMCRRYIMEPADNILKVTCDDKPVIEIHLDGTSTEYPTKEGSYSSIAKVDEQQIFQTFDAGKGGFSVTYIRTEKGFDVVKSIFSPYLSVALTVRASYIPK